MTFERNYSILITAREQEKIRRGIGMTKEGKMILERLDKMNAKITDIQLTLESELRRVKERLDSIA